MICGTVTNAVAGDDALYSLMLGARSSDFYDTAAQACAKTNGQTSFNEITTSKVFPDAVKKCDIGSGWVFKYGGKWAKLGSDADSMKLIKRENGIVFVDIFEFDSMNNEDDDNCHTLAYFLKTSIFNVPHKVDYEWNQGEYGFDGKFRMVISNMSGKRVKYVHISLTGLNAVGDKMFTTTLRGIGPINTPSYGVFAFDNMNLRLVSSMKINSIRVEYIGGGTNKLNLPASLVSDTERGYITAYGICHGSFNFFGF